MLDCPLHEDAQYTISKLKAHFVKFTEAKGTLPTSLRKKYAKLLETLSKINRESVKMLEELEKRTALAFKQNFAHYNVEIIIVLSNTKKAIISTPVHTDNLQYDFKKYIQDKIEEIMKNDFKDLSVVSFTSEVKKQT
jgi:hypothetical protein